MRLRSARSTFALLVSAALIATTLALAFSAAPAGAAVPAWQARLNAVRSMSLLPAVSAELHVELGVLVPLQVHDDEQPDDSLRVELEPLVHIGRRHRRVEEQPRDGQPLRRAGDGREGDRHVGGRSVPRARHAEPQAQVRWVGPVPHLRSRRFCSPQHPQRRRVECGRDLPGQVARRRLDDSVPALRGRRVSEPDLRHRLQRADRRADRRAVREFAQRHFVRACAPVRPSCRASS